MKVKRTVNVRNLFSGQATKWSSNQGKRENLKITLIGFLKESVRTIILTSLILGMISCEDTSEESDKLHFDQLSDARNVPGYLEKVNSEFRATILSGFKQVALQNKLPELDEDFVMVNPRFGHVSPVVLIKDACNSSLADLEKGKDILLAYFNLPEDSEIASGFYMLNVKKIKGEWTGELKNLDGKTVLTRKVLAESKAYAGYFPGRTLGIYDEKYVVRFGAQLKEISFYLDVKVGVSKNIVIPQNKYAQAITDEILKFRENIESAMKNLLTIKGDVFISTRKDALLIAALCDINGTSVPVMFILSNKIKADFYTISRTTSQLKGELQKQLISTSFTDLSKYTSLNIGLIGGILGNQINSGYIGDVIQGEYHISLE